MWAWCAAVASPQVRGYEEGGRGLCVLSLQLVLMRSFCSFAALALFVMCVLEADHELAGCVACPWSRAHPLLTDRTGLSPAVLLPAHHPSCTTTALLLHTPGGFMKRAIRGTLEYMAPEVLLKKPASPASDVYALAIAINELATGGWFRGTRVWRALATCQRVCFCVCWRTGCCCRPACKQA